MVPNASQLVQDQTIKSAEYDAAIASINKLSIYNEKSYNKSLKVINEQLAKVLRVVRSEIWLLSETNFHSLGRFDAATNEHASGAIVSLDTVPIFVTALDASRCVDTLAKANDPQTIELQKLPLFSDNIGASLSAPVRLNGVLSGFVICSRQANSSSWTESEKSFACAMADQVSRIHQEYAHQREIGQLSNNDRKREHSTPKNNDTLQTQKMDVAAQLSLGMAHDINNLLTIINGNLEYLEERVQGDEKSLSAIQDLQLAGRRGAQLTDQLVKFGASIANDTKTIEIGATIKDLSPILTEQSAPKVDIIQKLHAGTIQSTVNEEDFRNLILSLCLNAKESMPTGGTTTISTSLYNVGEPQIAHIGTLECGTYVCVSVADTGVGLPQDIRNKIFEPFFTTKKSNGNAGLGLATAYGFIKRSQGALNIQSSLSRGTIFNVYLPTSEQTVDAPPEVPHTGKKKAELIGKTALVVDDELEIVSLIKRILIRSGMEVYRASSATEAIEILKARGPVDLLISDIVMPTGSSGLELANLTKKQRLADRIILMTGYSEKLVSSRTKEEPYEGLILKKPFQLDTLVDSIAQTFA